MIEHRFQCPCCWEEISMVLEPADGQQAYVEDCGVCCRPLLIRYTFFVDKKSDDAVTGFSVEAS